MTYYDIWQHPRFHVDEVYCINMPQCAERRAKMEEQFNRLDIPVTWVNGYVYNESVRWIPKFLRFKPKRVSIGAIGSFRTMCKLLLWSYFCKHRRILIFEDDVTLADNVVEATNDYLFGLKDADINPDIVYYEDLWCIRGQKEIPHQDVEVSNGIIATRVFDITGTYGIILSQRAIYRILNHLYARLETGDLLGHFDREINSARLRYTILESYLIPDRLVRHNNVNDSYTGWNTKKNILLK